MTEKLNQEALERAVDAYDAARLAAHGHGPNHPGAMSAVNKTSIAPMIEAAIAAYADAASASLAERTRERDEARELAYELKYAAAGGEDVPMSAHAVTVADVNRWRIEAEQRADAAEARVKALTEALEEIASRHIPDQPAAYGGDELDWAQRQHGNLRAIARAALASSDAAPESKEPVAWMHELTEPGHDPSVLFSRFPENPWGHWQKEHMNNCQWKATALYAAPQEPQP